MLVGDLNTQGNGRNPKQPGRMWRGGRGRRSGGQTGPAPLRGGWERVGVPTPGRTFGSLEDQGGVHLAFPLSKWVLGGLLGSQTWSSVLWGPLWAMWVLGA